MSVVEYLALFGIGWSLSDRVCRLILSSQWCLLTVAASVTGYGKNYSHARLQYAKSNDSDEEIMWKGRQQQDGLIK